MAQLLLSEEMPFGGAVADKLRETVYAVARGQLAGRRLLEIEGPYGLGKKSFATADADIGEAVQMGGGEARLRSAAAIPIPLIESTFEIGMRDVAAMEAGEVAFGLVPAVRAALAVARAEDQVVFWGSEPIGLKGLLNMPGIATHALGDWDAMGQPAEDIIKAAGVLEQRGFLGPYALALAPAKYDLLYRRYQEAAMLQIQHIREVVTGGEVKAPALPDGGVLVAVGKDLASIVVGQDLSIGFVGPKDGAYEFLLFESVAVKVQVPEAVVVLS